MAKPVSYDIYNKERNWFSDMGFNFNVMYPEDLFSPKYGGNFMVFFINEQKHLVGEGKQGIKISRPVLKPDGSVAVMDRNRRITANMSSVVSRRVNETTVTTGAIALYIPGGIQVNYQMSYDAVDLNFVVGAGVNDISALLSGGMSTLTTKEGFGKLVLDRLKNTPASDLANKATSALLATQGVIENPFKQLIFSGPNFRKFNFSFALYPRNQKEAVMINKIIEIFKYHMHPEEKDSTGGRFYVVPSDFDIEFYRIIQIGDRAEASKGTKLDDTVVFENQFLYAISTCVLSDMSVNYTPAPEGFITHYDGTPLGVVLQMNFVETEILTKKRIVEMNTYKFGQNEIPSAPVTETARGG
ncbi:MAG: hypothetical protein N3A54_00860 [Patescibacteria group bacterium]|nr:hypothetical protein [Patescibacteria group bacterium]